MICLVFVAMTLACTSISGFRRDMYKRYRPDQ